MIFNNGLQKIGYGSFCNCRSLESITFPSTLVEIGSDAFNYCHNLREVELKGIPLNLKNEELEDKLNEVRGVVQWESDKLFVSRATHQNWDDIRRDFGKITQLVSYYDPKEATTTFELALWNSTNRTAYRIDVPGPVKDTMLGYLDYI